MNPQALCVLGRQSKICLAEIESLYGADNITPIENQAVLINQDPASIEFERLGGVIKLGTVENISDTTSWVELQKYLINSVLEQLSKLPDGKVNLGISCYNLNVNDKQILAAGLTIKKLSKQEGRSLRLVPNKQPVLSSAQVFHNRLTFKNGLEFMLIKYGSKTILSKTIHVQNISSYSARDYNRPKRSPRTGMLPPKLAQIIINLATGSQSRPLTILDPFCGTGVILQEASLMGLACYGSDIDEEMIDYTRTNLEWLKSRFRLDLQESASLEVLDATNALWKKPFDIVASEVYLGQPFNQLPSNDKLESVRQICNKIITNFLANFAAQTPKGMRLCLAVPTWQTNKNVYVRLPLIDHLEKLGYNRVSFQWVNTSDLVYSRPDQIVGRELLIITRI